MRVLFYFPHESGQPTKAAVGPGSFFINTSANWILQTEAILRSGGVGCDLTRDLPRQGIVVGFVGDLPVNLRPSKDLYLISITADALPHPFANLNIVQNRRQTALIPRSIFIPHWPQPGLIKRDIPRGDTLKRAVYIGDRDNIASELLSSAFSEDMKTIGLDWEVRLSGHPKVHDYSDVDALVAVRSFQKRGYVKKPASKLQNAWLAGVPAILGSEIAYQEIGNPSRDYFEVKSVLNLIQALIKLRDDPTLFSNVVRRGLENTVGFRENIIQAWVEMLERAQSEYGEWQHRRTFVFYNLKSLFHQKKRALRRKALVALGESQNAI